MCSAGQAEPHARLDSARFGLHLAIVLCVDTGMPAAPGDAAPSDDSFVAPVQGVFNQLQFRSPLYVAKWLDDRHVVVGGGGGKRFGMTNGLALLAVSTAMPAEGQARSADTKLCDCVGTLDLKANIAWCVSNTVMADDGASGHFCVSHVDSFTLVRVAGLRRGAASEAADPKAKAPTAALTKVMRVALQSDDIETGEPDKKPVAMAGGLIFAAQDDGTVAVLRLAHLLDEAVARSAAAAKKGSPKKPATPASKDDGSTAAAAAANSKDNNYVDNDSFALMRTSDSDDVAATLPIGARVSDMTATVAPWNPSAVVFLGMTCQDRAFRIVQVNSATAAATRTIKLDGTALGFEDALMRSSLRLCTSFPVRLPSTKMFSDRSGSALEDDSKPKPKKAAQPEEPATNVQMLVLALVNRKAYAVPITLSKRATTPALQPPVEIGREAPTSVTFARLSSATLITTVFVGTADGSLVELLARPNGVDRKRVRTGLHVEPISAVALHGHGGVITADIGQRIQIMHCGPVRPRDARLLLYKPTRGGNTMMMIALVVSLILAIVIATLFPTWRDATWEAAW